ARAPRDGVHVRGHPGEVRRGGGRRRGLGARAARRHARPARHGPPGGRARDRRPGRGGGAGRRGGRRGLRPLAGRAERRVAAGGGGRRPGGEGGRLRLRGRRVEHRHREGGEPRHDPSRAAHGLREPARGGGAHAPGPAAPAPGDPHHLRLGLRGDHRGGARRPRAAREVRDLPPLPAPEPGHRGPRAHAHAPARGGLLRRPGRHLPRRGVLPVAALRRPPQARVARRPPALPGRQPGRGRVVGQGPGRRRAGPAPRGGRSRGRAGARDDDALGHHGGRRLRLGRGPHPARLRVSHRGPPARLPGSGLPRRPPLRPARALRHRHGARGLPLHLRGGARAPPPRGRAPGGRPARGPGPRHAPGRPARAHARRGGAVRDRRARLRGGGPAGPRGGRAPPGAPARGGAPRAVGRRPGGDPASLPAVV
ncbi:MAG: Alcohol dehydrogenase; Adhfe1 homolog, partial [uncultured Solirubrobacteraceae bacterium]